jgi:hypothetical protein
MTHGIGVTVRGGVVALNGTIFRGNSKRYFPEPSAARQRQASEKTVHALRFQRMAAPSRVSIYEPLVVY